MKCIRLFSGLLLATSAVYGAASPWETNPQGQVRLIAPTNTAPQDKTFTFGVQFKPAPGWMVYWKNPGDAGYAPKFNFAGSTGFDQAQVLWPRPRFFLLPGDIKEYGYEHEVVYPVKAQRTKAGAVHIVAKVDYLTCKDSCIPYRYTLTLDLPSGPPAEDAEMSGLIQGFLKQVPPEGENVLASLVAEKIDPTPDTSLWLVLLFGFIGGAILNIMPCVLPVLSIKLFGLLQHAGQAQIVTIRDALASAAGIIVSFLIGAGLTIAAQNAGRAAGWGVQFQNPAFVVFLMALVLLFALNLWGVFEIHLPPALGRLGTLGQNEEGPVTFFLSGMFATLLATPCSAPFLGTAMGFALAQPAGITLAIFGAAGLGMALPYFALAAFPESLDWLPRPGRWMEKVKRVLGACLFATAIWLGWVLMQQLHPTASVAENGPITWVPFQEDQIAPIVASGRPVFVDVTADWCVTCKVNEKLVLQNAEVVAEFKKRNFVMMRADWTNKNVLISHYLAKHGRAGIPFYALYYPHREPVLLSEFLTKKQVLRELRTRDSLQ